MIKLLSGVSRRGGIGSKRCVELIISEKRERYNAKIKGKMRKETKTRRNLTKSVDNSGELRYVNYWRMAYLNSLHNCKKQRKNDAIIHIKA